MDNRTKVVCSLQIEGLAFEVKPWNILWSCACVNQEDLGFAIGYGLIVG
jgi:hypothetical protein